MKSSRLARWTAAAGAVATLVAGLVATATPAAAAEPIQGLQKVTAVTDFSTQSTKDIAALCPPGKVVIGGGGRVVEAGTPTHRVRLKQLEPSNSIFTPEGTRQGYRVSAVDTDPAVFRNWRLEAYAMCAFPISGLEIVPGATTDVTAIRQEREVRCPADKRLIGSGARINLGGSNVALQLARTTPSGDLLRVGAREDALGSAGNWNLVGFAVCAPRPSGYEIKFGESPARLSETVKTAHAVCSPGRRVIGSGAAIAATLTTPEDVAFEEVNPFATDGVRATAVENSPTGQNWDFIVATATCADATT